MLIKEFKMITYPRKCVQCDYIATSPQTYSYHKRKHKPIPHNALCEGGCGQVAKFRMTNNRLMCSDNSFTCPAYLKQHSDRVQTQWDNSPERKQQLSLSGPMTSQISRDKLSETQKKRWRERILIIESEVPADMKQYKRQVHTLSQRTYKEYKDTINPNNFSLGRRRYHLDHKVSKHVGWLLNIPAVYMASLHNLEVIPSTINEGKGPVCSMLPSVLLEKCNAPIDLIEAVRSQEIQLGHLVGL